jgi:hypothetical protein
MLCSLVDFPSTDRSISRIFSVFDCCRNWGITEPLYNTADCLMLQMKAFSPEMVRLGDIAEADGDWRDDPANLMRRSNGFGTENCIVVVE